MTARRPPTDRTVDDRRRWVTTVLVAVLVAVGCVAAGAWQWSRHADRSDAVAVVERNYEAPVADLAELLDPDRPLPADAEWRRAAVTGRYVGEPVLLRNRPVSGTPALHVLQPLLVEDGPLEGAVLVVDRGWVPSGEEGDGLVVPSPPAGTVDVVVRLRREETSSGRDAPSRQVQEIVVDAVRAASGAPPEWPAGAGLALYGGLVSEDGAAAPGLGRLPAPQTTLGTNLSYAFQWWVFALGALAAPVVLRRKEQRDAEDAAEAAESATTAAAGDAADPADDASKAGGTAPPDDDVAGRVPGTREATRPARRPRRRRRPTAEEEEDALLDAHAAAQRDAR
nr:SURF1 family protein [uncultured Actinotalea sp.]